MTRCIHGMAAGMWCSACNHVIRASVSDREWSHYFNAPPSHTCSICQRCADEAANHSRN